MNRISLISSDIKRLKSHKFVSLQEDLDDLFKEVEKKYNETGMMPNSLYNEANYSIHKVRMAISNPKRPASKAARLWIYFDRRTNTYYEALLYIAEEKPKFRSSVCYKIIRERIAELII